MQCSAEHIINQTIKGTLGHNYAFCDDVFAELRHYITKKQHICIATKGIEVNTCLFINDVLEKYIKTKNVAIISGPSFAIDIINHDPIGLALASKNDQTCDLILEIFICF